MNRIIRIVHSALTVIAWGIFILSLIRIVAIWNNLPDNIGVHFDSSGEFDVIGSKYYAAYPYIVSLAVLVFCEVSTLLSNKINIGMKISEKGSIKIRTAIKIILDVSKLGLSFFFAGIWADCVIRQHSLNTYIPMVIMLILILIYFLFIVYLILIKIKNPPE